MTSGPPGRVSSLPTARTASTATNGCSTAPDYGATGQSYTPTAADAGHQLSCKATVTYPLLVVTASATSTAVPVKGAAEQLGDLADAVVGVGPGGSLAGKVSAIQGYVAATTRRTRAPRWALSSTK